MNNTELRKGLCKMRSDIVDLNKKLDTLPILLRQEALNNLELSSINLRMLVEPTSEYALIDTMLERINLTFVNVFIEQREFSRNDLRLVFDIIQETLRRIDI